MITVELKEEKASVMVHKEQGPDEKDDKIVCALLSILIFAYAVSMRIKQRRMIKILGDSNGCGVEPRDSWDVPEIYRYFLLMFLGIRFVHLIFPENVKIRYEE